MYIIILTTALLGTVLVAAERRHHTGGIGSLVRHLNADPLSHLHTKSANTRKRKQRSEQAPCFADFILSQKKKLLPQFKKLYISLANLRMQIYTISR